MLGVLIRIPEWGSATVLEIAWTAIGAATLLIVAWNYAGARASMAVTLDFEDEYEIAAAHVIRFGYLRREAVRFAIGVIIFAIGITGDYQAPITKPSVATLTGLVLTAGLFVIGLVTVVQSFFDGRDRLRVRDLLMKSSRARADSEWQTTRQTVGLDD